LQKHSAKENNVVVELKPVPYFESEPDVEVHVLRMRGDIRQENFLCELDDAIRVVTNGEMASKPVRTDRDRRDCSNQARFDARSSQREFERENSYLIRICCFKSATLVDQSPIIISMCNAATARSTGTMSLHDQPVPPSSPS